MKKLLMSLSILGILGITSCKDKEESVIETQQGEIQNNTTTDETEEELEDEYTNASKTADQVPQFSNPEIQAFAEEYATYFKEIIEADKNGNEEKVRELLSEGVNWARKSTEWTQKMNAEDAQKWLEWSSQLQILASGQ